MPINSKRNLTSVIAIAVAMTVTPANAQLLTIPQIVAALGDLTDDVTDNSNAIIAIDADVSILNDTVVQIQADVDANEIIDTAQSVLIDTLDDRLTDSENAILGLDADIAVNTGNISVLNGQVAVNTGDIAALIGDVSLLNGDITALNGDLSLLSGQVAVNTGDISALNGDLSLLTGDVSLLSGQVAVNTGDISVLTGDLSLLNGQVGVNTGDIALLNGDLSLLSGQVAVNTGDISALNGDLSLLTGDVSLLSGQVAINTGDISALNGDLSLLSGQVAINTGDISILNGQVAVNTGDIAVLTGDVALLGSQVAINTGDINALNGQVAVNTGDIATLNGQVAVNTGDIATLNGQVAANTGDIAALGAQVAVNTGNIATLDVRADNGDVRDDGQDAAIAQHIGMINNAQQTANDAWDETVALHAAMAQSGVGMVQQQSVGGVVTVGADVGGTVLDVSGTDGDRRITGVAPGVANNDAVNVSQMNATLNSAMAYTDSSIASLSFDLERMNQIMQDNNRELHREIGAAAAGAAALAGLPQAFQPGKGMVAVGIGGHGSSTAFAIGIGKAFDIPHTPVVRAGAAIGTRKGDLTYNAAVGFHF